jgi:hypothetical protein
MKATRTTTTTMKRSCCTFLFLTIVVSAGCTTTDNNVGSLGNDSAVAGGSGQDARDGKPASACTADSDCPVGLSCGYAVADGCAAKGVCIQSNFQGAVGPDYMCGCDGRGILPVLIQDSGSSSTVLYVSAPYSGWAGPCVGLPDAAVFDSAGMGKDVGPESISADAGRVCLYPAGADTSVEVGNGSFVGCRPGLTQDLCDPSSYQMTCQASGLTPASIPQPASTLNCKAVPVQHPATRSSTVAPVPTVPCLTRRYPMRPAWARTPHRTRPRLAPPIDVRRMGRPVRPSRPTRHARPLQDVSMTTRRDATPPWIRPWGVAPRPRVSFVHCLPRAAAIKARQSPPLHTGRRTWRARE